MKIFYLIGIISMLCHTATGQIHGVCPIGATDRQTDQLRGKVATVRLKTWKADNSRRIVQKSEQIADKMTEYDNGGNIVRQTSYDTSGEVDTKTIFQYKGGVKNVSTTYNQAGERSLQTLYAYTNDGILARMRLTDADAVTISTTEVSHSTTQTSTEEEFKDGEKVTTTMTYDSQYRLRNVVRSDGKTSNQMKLRIGTDGLPSKGLYTNSDGTEKKLTFDHEKDKQGNWTRRTVYVDGVAVEVSEREISYY